VITSGVPSHPEVRLAVNGRDPEPNPATILVATTGMRIGFSLFYCAHSPEFGDALAADTNLKQETVIDRFTSENHHDLRVNIARRSPRNSNLMGRDEARLPHVRGRSGLESFERSDALHL
jgi:hypothetical protein